MRVAIDGDQSLSKCDNNVGVCAREKSWSYDDRRLCSSGLGKFWCFVRYPNLISLSFDSQMTK